jgi:hypothetical protein
MAGRPRKPTNLLEMSGALKKNPKRGKAREGEPRPDASLGAPPERWKPHPLAAQASALFAQDKSTNEVASALQIDWETAKSLRDQNQAADNAQLCGLWEEVQLMAPWLTAADRWTVESIVELKLIERKGTIKPGERAELGRLCGKCGLNPSDRTRVNVSSSPARPAAAADPREAFMRKAGTG